MEENIRPITQEVLLFVETLSLMKSTCPLVFVNTCSLAPNYLKIRLGVLVRYLKVLCFLFKSSLPLPELVKP